MTRLPRNKSGLLLTVALHVALLGALLQRHPAPPTPAGGGPAIQWLLPLAPARTAKATSAAPPAALAALAASAASAARRPAAKPQPTQPRRAAGQPEAGALPEPIAASAAAAQEQDAVRAAPSAGDLSATPAAPAPASPAPAGAAALLGRTTYGAGQLDRELRGGKLAKLNQEDAALRANVDMAFREAVARKWYEPATITEISTPSDRVRVYKMKTLAGTVCISIPDPSLEKRTRYTITNCAREK
ncbi:hypothetical protein [Pseudoduganella sp. UC29_71]|uniref:hypothetical protein n=1 Tax=Pseudoduganella sp. UC29_71 TaxID=3350174 RepID=UPI00366E7E9D